jgi:hypothetical protein
MSTELLTVVALLCSGLALAVLAWRDPKRRRRQGLIGAASVPERRALAGVTVLPGLGLSLLGAWPALLLWLAGITLLGWALAWLLREPATAHP